MIKSNLLLATLLLAFQSSGQKLEINFNVIFKDKAIGKIVATEEKIGSEIIHDIKSQTDAKVMVFSVHVESDMKIKKGNGVMIEGIAYRTASRGAEDVHSSTKRVGSNKYERTRNGKQTLFTKGDITFCVADMYFREPTGISAIYSNMYAELLTLKSLGAGRYEVITPDKKNTIYSYKAGKLMQVEASTPLGQVISKRI